MHSLHFRSAVAAGLIDYNFHCFRKAIQEVFEVGVSAQRTGLLRLDTPSPKAMAQNGTPRGGV